MVRAWSGTGKDRRSLENTSETLVLTSMPTTAGGVGIGQWHKL